MNEAVLKMILKTLGYNPEMLPSAEEIGRLFEMLAKIPRQLDEIISRLDALEKSLADNGVGPYNSAIPDISQGKLLIEDNSDA